MRHASIILYNFYRILSITENRNFQATLIALISHVDFTMYNILVVFYGLTIVVGRFRVLGGQGLEFLGGGGGEPMAGQIPSRHMTS